MLRQRCHQGQGSSRAEGLKNVEFYQLDVIDPQSVATFTLQLRQRFGVLDILLRLTSLHCGFTALYILDEYQVTMINWQNGWSLTSQVNDAGVSFNEIDSNSVEHTEIVIKTNFYGPKLLTESLMPLFRGSPLMSRILNISSQLGLQTVSGRVEFSNPKRSLDAIVLISFWTFLSLKVGSWDR